MLVSYPSEQKVAPSHFQSRGCDTKMKCSDWRLRCEYTNEKFDSCYPLTEFMKTLIQNHDVSD